MRAALALPAGALEATLLYARGDAAARVRSADARAAWSEALTLLGKEPGPARLEAFRVRIRARLAAKPAVATTHPDAGLEVRIFELSDLLDALERVPFPRVDLVGPEGSRPEEPLSLLMTAAIEQLPSQAGGRPPEFRGLGAAAPDSEPPRLLEPTNGVGNSFATSALGKRKVNAVVKAAAAQQEALQAILLAWRDVWPLLWPAATS